MKIVLFILISFLLAECPELIHIDYTHKDPRFQSRNNVVENPITDSNVINSKVNEIYSNITSINGIICNDSFVYPKFCDGNEELFLNHNNFEFIGLIQNTNENTEYGHFYVNPKCNLRNEIPFALKVNYYIFFQIRDTIYQNLSISPRVYHKDHEYLLPEESSEFSFTEQIECIDLPNLNLNKWAEHIDNCELIDSLKQAIFYPEDLVEYKIINGNKSAYPYIKNIKKYDILNPDNFDFLGAKLSNPYKNKISGSFLLKPKCNIRNKIPFYIDIWFRYNDKPSQDKKIIVLTHYITSG